MDLPEVSSRLREVRGFARPVTDDLARAWRRLVDPGLRAPDAPNGAILNPGDAAQA